MKIYINGFTIEATPEEARQLIGEKKEKIEVVGKPIRKKRTPQPHKHWTKDETRYLQNNLGKTPKELAKVFELSRHGKAAISSRKHVIKRLANGETNVWGKGRGKTPTALSEWVKENKADSMVETVETE